MNVGGKLEPYSSVVIIITQKEQCTYRTLVALGGDAYLAIHCNY